MGLKGVHLVFIICGSIVSFWFGLWSFEHASVVTGIVSIAVGLSLLAYCAWFLKKLRGIGFLLLVLGLNTLVQDAFACATCYGDPQSIMVKSTNHGVLVLLAVVALVLSGFGGLF